MSDFNKDELLGQSIDHIDGLPAEIIYENITKSNLSIIKKIFDAQKQAEKLCELGCFNQQGYLYSKPLNAHDFEQWIIGLKQRYENKNKAQKKG